MKRYIFTGSRDWEPVTLMEEVFRRIVSRCQVDEVVIVHGDCPTGVDALVDRIARRYGFKVECHPANWKNYGTRAGPMRNSRMVAAGAVLCLAFSRDINKSRGTKDTAVKAIKARILTFLFYGETYEHVRRFGLSEIDQ